MWHIHWKLSFSQNTWCRFYYKFTDSIFWSNGFFRSRLIWISTFARPGQILIQEEKSKRYSFVWESVEKINLKAGNKKKCFHNYIPVLNKSMCLKNHLFYAFDSWGMLVSVSFVCLLCLALWQFNTIFCLNINIKFVMVFFSNCHLLLLVTRA